MVHEVKGRGREGRASTNHDRSSPFSKKLQSPFSTQFQPPMTPRPLLQSTRGTSPGLFASHSAISSVGFSSAGLLRTNLDMEHVPQRKSSVLGSAGMSPVSARPMQIMLAACVHSRRARGLAGSTSRAVMMRCRAYALRLCSPSMVSPVGLGRMAEA